MILFNPHDNPGSLALLIISVIYFFLVYLHVLFL